MTRREWKIVLAVFVELMAGVTAHFSTLGKTGLIVKHATKIDLGFCEFVVGAWGLSRERLEHHQEGI
jgi:hypothetical protein